MSGRNTGEARGALQAGKESGAVALPMIDDQAPFEEPWPGGTTATLTGPCGDTMRFDLRIDGDVAADVRFLGRGCRHSRLCGTFVAEMAKGRNLDELPDITPDFIARNIPELPSEEAHCAQLAYETLMEALDRYFSETVRKGRGK